MDDNVGRSSRLGDDVLPMGAFRVISVFDFHKAYGSMLAVKGVSFEVRGGEILGLIGPNGAGKTTTLRALSGIISPSQGTLAVGGHDLTRETVAAKRTLAYIPDDPQLFPDLTVREHLAFTAAAYGVANPDPVSQELLTQFELVRKQDTLARDLSRGMRQKLAICCGYLHQPRAIFLDEPLTGLDPHGIRTLKESIRQRAEAGAAIIVSSHLLAMVEDICTHVLILKEGQQRFFGPVGGLKTAFITSDHDTSLERIFFLATDHAEHTVVGAGS
ncbi:MAG: ABC transporter ATP-binding protein [Planctomycetaceae bacterium]